ncbi:DUF3427 domain-containing protein [Bifidobacterium aerophilum]|uniref:DUF3427 domain-containing protein n=1 Tax=Bifidobacterium aerophilum TaxID=1798155 RepID=A0A6N9Z473_9BIFI|nr:DUF3427 domain-containing protein [Bifidobacterium aerophilum]NEG89144.1 DUF3427 domain-containing protein [Bifidobacterium aerophilum]
MADTVQNVPNTNRQSRLPLAQQNPYDDATYSVLESAIAGFIEPRENAADDYKPTLISNRPGGLTMHDQISDALANSESFDISVAFVSTGAVLSLFEDFRSHHANAVADTESGDGSASTTSASHVSRLITSTKNHFNDPQAFWELLHLQRTAGVDVRVWEGADDGSAAISQGQGQPFHPKGYVFARRMHNGTPYYELFVGSSNLTGAALNTQREWNLKVSSLADGELVRQIREEIDSQVADSVPLTEEWIERYEEDFKKYAPPRRDILKSLESRDIQPNAMQREALANLKKLRDQGEHRAIIVSATGTGKTYLSAFDVRACRPKRMLYVAQQQMILKAAMKSYQKVLGCDESELGLYSGTSKQQDRRYVFATVQTLSKDNALEQFASDEFDYVLVDEVHHAGANSYQRVIDHFKDADFMLGMTATPERTDGINIFELFGHNIAYEIRLQKALDENMLCSFHYYGVAEYLGSDDDPNQSAHRLDIAHGLDTEQSAQLKYEIGQLATKQRVRYIIDKLQEYGQFNLPVTGLVFCSRQDEAHELSRLFNQQWNQQAERLYRTAAVTSKDADGKPISPERRDEYVRRLTDGELDYLFTVDLFNEGVDIPAVNQIVMLRSTESSIVFTQQLGRGLRKFPHKDSVVVIDFIGNYNNNYLIPVALYGNTGDRDRARRNLQRKSIGLSSISFDPIAKERVLKSLDTADWSEMKKLSEQYRQVRYELGRIPMLMDIYDYDPSLPYTLAAKRNNYLDFVRSRENSLGGGKRRERSFADQLEPVSDVEDAILKMATELLLPGIRPHELVILDRLCRFTDERPGDDDAVVAAAGAGWVRPSVSLSRSSLIAAIRTEFPQADLSDDQFDSAISVLDYSYFTKPNRKRFGEQPLIETIGVGTESGELSYRLSDAFAALLAANRTFRIFFADTLRTGLANCRDLFREAQANQRTFDRAFLYERKYSMADVMRLCGWKKENTPQNVGGYLLDKDTNTMPIFVKYAASQYEDEFLNAQEMRYFSKNGRTPQSPEFQWVRDDFGAGASAVGDADAWQRTHFVPLFVMRKAEEADGKYYYVGHVAAFDHPTLTTKPNAAGDGTVKVTLSTLRLAKPLDPELYRHLTS